MKRVYHIENEGDLDVGINCFDGKVTVDVNVEIDDDDFIKYLDKDMKELLKSHFELETRCNVLTEDEYKEREEAIEDYIWEQGEC
jgi:hypothetical protein